MRKTQGANLFLACLRAVFDLPASLVLIIGDWKVGKTDFSLYLAEILLKMKIIHKVGTNIWIEKSKPNSSNLESKFRYIDNIPDLKRFLFGDRFSKLFIYDEVVTSTPKRRAMSKINVEWVKIIPELSKGRAKLIAITQEQNYMDSIFNNPVFLRGIFYKVSKKKAILRSHLMRLPRLEIKPIPRTRLEFDPYRIAVMRPEKDIIFDFKKDDESMVWEYLSEDSQFFGNYSKIGRKRNMKAQQVKRIILKTLKEMLLTKG